MTILYIKLRTWFYNFMQVQLFLSLISLPVLVAWGLPFSLMTVCGNLLFTPLLSLFLLCSSFVFFFELLSLPNNFLITILEKLFAFWMYCLRFGSTSWLYGIDYGGLLISLLCALCACLILQHRAWGRPRKSWYLFALLLCIPFTYQKISSYFPRKAHITCLRKTALISSQNGKVSVFDKGALGEKQAAGTWIQYTFLAEVLKKCGSITFDTITCLNPTVRTLEAVATLCQHAPVAKIIVQHPYRKSQDYKKAWHALEYLAQQEKVKLEESKFCHPERSVGTHVIPVKKEDIKNFDTF